ncbi:NAD(P)-binding protein [Aspergillus steynii IBT 23096]|uniref:NAD(P)-binding protein n=1 Tax=Aspergillus steynii IBT 23096 TaxID=1392250 RepID=A0A2I2G0J8_9EURO|nr:NAD(P)-binding protein [Aspergillus steynii IBT 23096]PLB46399.1 NAD(P)-binding protein [Aspergillus steynii IBT 23096]
MRSVQTIAFFGASTGVGLAALKHTLLSGDRAIALCRDPSKLAGIVSDDSNLKIVKGDAHDVAAVSKCLQREDGKLVDAVITTIGSKPVMNGIFLTLEDPEVCQKGMKTLLEALDQRRRDGVSGSPYIVACSTTGTSRFGRDYPLALFPVYDYLLRVPAADKKAMEDLLVASQETYTIVRPSRLVDGVTTKQVRVGIEDPQTGPIYKAIGYSISREDSGRWIAQNLVLKRDTVFYNKIASITN